MRAIIDDHEKVVLFRCSFQPEVVRDVIFGVVVVATGVKVRVKFGDSRSNRSPNIRLPHFVRTTTTTHADGPLIIGQNAAFCLRTNIFFCSK